MKDFWENVPWSKILPIIYVLLGVGGGVGGTDLYKKEGDEARKRAWQAINAERNALVISYKELRDQCEEELKAISQDNKDLLVRVLQCSN